MIVCVTSCVFQRIQDNHIDAHKILLFSWTTISIEIGLNLNCQVDNVCVYRQTFCLKIGDEMWHDDDEIFIEMGTNLI